ncbi:Chorismate synthase [uncultured archaeon]|nr:Chorismate synthase [uncultured archaeon]
MAGNTFGKLFKVTSFGESHGEAVGCVIDGCPAGMALSESDIQAELDKRKPSEGIASTKRTELDKAKILSGVFEGKTTGAPIAIIVQNEDSRPKDYGSIAKLFRPGHADYTYFKKYGLRDYRGGGRSSGRETIARVAAGAIAKKILAQKGITISGFVSEIGGIEAKNFSEKDVAKVYENQFRVPDKEASKKIEDAVKKSIIAKDSLGGIIEIRASGVPAGLGEPVFEKLDAQIAGALMGIGAVKGVEIGAGFGCAKSTGSKNNDPIRIVKGEVSFMSNNAGGILGGVSSGQEIIVRAAVKPTSSIAQKQKTISENMVNADIEVIGRHDVCIAPRVLPVAECMVAIVLVNALLENLGSKISESK